MRTVLAVLALLSTPALAGTPVDLAISGSCPGPVDFTMTGVPGTSFMLVAGDREGSTTVPSGRCAGTEIGIESAGPLSVFGPFRDADRDGTVRLSPTVPMGVCDKVLVALDLSACADSPPARFDAGDAEADPDCAANPLWTPVTCVNPWEWTNDRSIVSRGPAEAARALFTGCGHSGAVGDIDGTCSMTGEGYVSVDTWPMLTCDENYAHIVLEDGGAFGCGGHSTAPPGMDIIRRLSTTDMGCYDYRSLPDPG
ncbi:MAG: hypothetical protein ACI8PZ_004158 [Myxococcota bacterium]|jgi:hypothetical protein